MGKRTKLAAVATPILVKLDFGCGPNVRDGFEGVDQYKFDGKVKHVLDIVKDEWPWNDASVEEAHASHFLEHLTSEQRISFCNNLYRALIPGGKCQIIVPHWASCRAYGDPTHQWPPVSEFWFYYLNRDWRKANAPHADKEHWNKGYDCNFEATWGYSLRGDVVTRNQEYQQFAMQNYKEVCQDLIATLVKK